MTAFRKYIAFVAALLVSAATFAHSDMSHLNYLRYMNRHGVEETSYVFARDEKGKPWLTRTVNDRPDATVRKKASRALIRDLQELVEKGEVFSYAPSYEPKEEVCGGYVWELEIQMKDGRSVRSYGHSAQPANSILEDLESLLNKYLEE